MTQTNVNNFLTSREVEKIVESFGSTLHEEFISPVGRSKKNKGKGDKKKSGRKSDTDTAAHGDQKRLIRAGRKSVIEKPRKKES